MHNKRIIKSISKFTKTSENKIEDYLSTNDLSSLFEHPETIGLSIHQLDNLKNLIKLSNLYNRVTKYKNYKFDKTIDMVDYLKSCFYSKFDKEYFLAMFLDDENKLLGIETISIGTINSSIVHPRDVFKQAFKYKAKRIVISHNHPSGDPIPSKDDFNVTKRLKDVGSIFNIKVLDHIIIGKNDFYSFKEERQLVSNTSIKKTINKSHKLIHKKDISIFLNLLNKVTKIPKRELQNTLNKISVRELIECPELHLSQKEHINSINMLRELSIEYNNASYIPACKINQPDDITNYILNKYGIADKIDVVIFLNTKNKIINSLIIPENLSNDDKITFIMKNAILHDSNSYVLARKDKNLPSLTDTNRISEVKEIDLKSRLVGINLIDKIDIKLYSGVSYKQMNFLEEKNHYKAPSRKMSMEDRFKNDVEIICQELINGEREYKKNVDIER